MCNPPVGARLRSMRTLFFLLALLAPCAASAQSAPACVALPDSRRAPASIKLGRGLYRLILVASRGTRAGHASSGTLELWPPSSTRDRSTRRPAERPPADTGATPFYGATTVDFADIGAPVSARGDEWVPAPSSRDPLHPGVLVLASRTPGGSQSPTMLVIGTVSNRRVAGGPLGLDGEGIYLAIRRQRGDTISGYWGGYGRRVSGSGHFCLVATSARVGQK